jgi:hypothetical protein
MYEAEEDFAFSEGVDVEVDVQVAVHSRYTDP